MILLSSIFDIAHLCHSNDASRQVWQNTAMFGEAHLAMVAEVLMGMFETG